MKEKQQKPKTKDAGEQLQANQEGAKKGGNDLDATTQDANPTKAKMGARSTLRRSLVEQVQVGVNISKRLKESLDRESVELGISRSLLVDLILRTRYDTPKNKRASLFKGQGGKK